MPKKESSWYDLSVSVEDLQSGSSHLRGPVGPRLDAHRDLMELPASSSVNIQYPSGYWKVSNGAITPLQCPLVEGSCLGGDDFAYSEDASSSCSSAYSGPLCASCTPDRFIDYTDRTCESCSFGNIIGRFAFLAPLLFLLPLWLCMKIGRVASTNRNKKGANNRPGTNQVAERGYIEWLDTQGNAAVIDGVAPSTSPDPNTLLEADDADFARNEVIKAEKMESTAFSILSRLKIILSFMQMVAVLPSAFRVTFPPLTSHVLRYYGLVSLASIQFFPLSCVLPTYNSVVALLLSSAAPLCAILCMCIAYTIHRAVARRKTTSRVNDYAAYWVGYPREASSAYLYVMDRIRVRYWTLGILTAHICVFGCTLYVVGLSQCTNIDPDNVTGEKLSFMFKYGEYLSALVLLLILIGVPLTSLVLVYRKRDVLKKLSSDESSSPSDCTIFSSLPRRNTLEMRSLLLSNESETASSNFPSSPSKPYHDHHPPLLAGIGGYGPSDDDDSLLIDSNASSPVSSNSKQQQQQGGGDGINKANAPSSNFMWNISKSKDTNTGTGSGSRTTTTGTAGTATRSTGTSPLRKHLVAREVLSAPQLDDASDRSNNADVRRYVYGIAGDNDSDVEEDSAQDTALVHQKATSHLYRGPDSSFRRNDYRGAPRRRSATLTESNFGVRLMTEEIVYSDTGDSFVQPSNDVLSPRHLGTMKNKPSIVPKPGSEYVCEYAYHYGEEMKSPVVPTPKSHNGSFKPFSSSSDATEDFHEGEEEDSVKYGGVDICAPATATGGGLSSRLQLQSQKPSAAGAGAGGAASGGDDGVGSVDKIGDEVRDRESIRHLRILFEEYRLECWWWEAYQAVKRSLFALQLILIAPGSMIQVLVAVVTSAYNVYLTNSLNPYKKSHVQTSTMATLINFQMLFVCLSAAVLCYYDAVAAAYAWIDAVMDAVSVTTADMSTSDIPPLPGAAAVSYVSAAVCYEVFDVILALVLLASPVLFISQLLYAASATCRPSPLHADGKEENGKGSATIMGLYRGELGSPNLVSVRESTSNERGQLLPSISFIHMQPSGGPDRVKEDWNPAFLLQFPATVKQLLPSFSLSLFSSSGTTEPSHDPTNKNVSSHLRFLQRRKRKSVEPANLAFIGIGSNRRVTFLGDDHDRSKGWVCESGKSHPFDATADLQPPEDIAANDTSKLDKLWWLSSNEPDDTVSKGTPPPGMGTMGMGPMGMGKALAARAAGGVKVEEDRIVTATNTSSSLSAVRTGTKSSSIDFNATSGDYVTSKEQSIQPYVQSFIQIQQAIQPCQPQPQPIQQPFIAPVDSMLRPPSQRSQTQQQPFIAPDGTLLRPPSLRSQHQPQPTQQTFIAPDNHTMMQRPPSIHTELVRPLLHTASATFTGSSNAVLAAGSSRVIMQDGADDNSECFGVSKVSSNADADAEAQAQQWYGGRSQQAPAARYIESSPVSSISTSTTPSACSTYNTACTPLPLPPPPPLPPTMLPPPPPPPHSAHSEVTKGLSRHASVVRFSDDVEVKINQTPPPPPPPPPPPRPVSMEGMSAYGRKASAGGTSVSASATRGKVFFQEPSVAAYAGSYLRPSETVREPSQQGAVYVHHSYPHPSEIIRAMAVELSGQDSGSGSGDSDSEESSHHHYGAAAADARDDCSSIDDSSSDSDCDEADVEVGMISRDTEEAQSQEQDDVPGYAYHVPVEPHGAVRPRGNSPRPSRRVPTPIPGSQALWGLAAMHRSYVQEEDEEHDEEAAYASHSATANRTRTEGYEESKYYDYDSDEEDDDGWQSREQLYTGTGMQEEQGQQHGQHGHPFPSPVSSVAGIQGPPPDVSPTAAFFSQFTARNSRLAVAVGGGNRHSNFVSGHGGRYAESDVDSHNAGASSAGAYNGFDATSVLPQWS